MQDTFHTCLYNGKPLPDPHYGEQPLYGLLCQSRLRERTFSVDLADEGSRTVVIHERTYVGEGVGRRPSLKNRGGRTALDIAEDSLNKSKQSIEAFKNAGAKFAYELSGRGQLQQRKRPAKRWSWRKRFR